MAMDMDGLVGKDAVGLLEALDTQTTGLSHEDATKRLHRYGLNELKVHKQTPAFLIFLKEFKELFPLLLLVAAALSFFAHTRRPDEGYQLISFALAGVVILNATVSFLQKYKTEKIMLSFLEYIPERVTVKREGKKYIIEAKKLVPGDIIYFSEGDKLPADVVTLRANGVLADESILTGESEPIEKLPFSEVTAETMNQGLLFSGSSIIKGDGKAIVFHTGLETKFGRIHHLAEEVRTTMTPIQKQLRKFVKKITYLALGIGFLFFLVGWLIGNPFWTNLIFAIGIIVANVPEGLLPTVTLALTQASQKMARRKAVVKDILSVETLGSTTVICTDKTGTLTQNRMTAKRVYTDLQDYPLDGQGLERLKAAPSSSTFMEISRLCTTAKQVVSHDTYKYVGDPTEVALLELADLMGSSNDMRAEFSVLNEKSFSSSERYMSISFLTKGNQRYTLFKGAPEVILGMCHQHHKDGSAQSLDAETRKRLREVHQGYERDGLRTLGLAYIATPNEGNLDDIERRSDLIFVGFVGMHDPPRPEVHDAVRRCKDAGIRIIPISGDKSETVVAIAREIGIVEKPHVIKGDQLKEMTDGELKEALGKPELVFARTAPEQKLRIVQVLQEMGEVVAVTGDGVNDAPALKKADIGVAMGRSGTDVAKEASNIILLDDNFATIVAAIEEGRAVYDNIKKFINYILTSNVPEILPFIIFVLFPVPLAMTVIGILSIDLITDILPAIGLGNEAPESDVMRRKPRKQQEQLVTWRTFLRSYGIIGPLESLMAFSLFFLILWKGGWRYGQELGASDPVYLMATGAFLAAIVFSQIGNVFANRTRRTSGFTKLWQRNSWVWWGVFVELVFIVAITAIPAAHGFFSTSPLPLWVWGLLLPMPFLIFMVEEIRKWMVRRGVRFLDT